MGDAAAGEVTLTFPSPPPRERVRRYFRGLAGFPGAFFLGVSLVPGVTLYALEANPPFPAWALGIGAGLFTFSVVAAALSALIQPQREFILELSVAGIRESCRGKTIDRGWSWVERVVERANSIEIYVRADGMKSFRIGTPAPRRLLVDKRAMTHEMLGELKRLLALR